MTTKPKSKRRMALLLTGCAAIALPRLARADTTWDPTVADGSWNTPANWLGGALPAASDSVTISFNDGADHTITYDGNYSSATGTVTLNNQGGGNTNLVLSNSYSLSAQYIQLGSNGNAGIQQSDGTITASQDLVMAGGGASDVATYELSGGTLSLTRLDVGHGGNATFSQTGGTLLFNSNGITQLNFGFYDSVSGAHSGSGQYDLSGGTLIASGSESIGWNDNSSQFIQTGGTHINTSTYGPGADLDTRRLDFPDEGSDQPLYTYLLEGGTLITNTETTDVRGMKQSGGVHKVGSSEIPGLVQGGYTITGGELDVVGLQYGGNVQSGGTVNFGAEGSASASSLYGFYSLTGGELNTIGSITLGVDSALVVSQAAFSQSGGTHNLGTASSPSNLFLGYSSFANDRGTYLLSSDGLLNVIGSEYVGFSGLGSFLQSGGTHEMGTVSSPSQLYVGYNSSAKGLYKLSAGTFLASGTEFVGYDGLGTLAISGSGMHMLSGNMYLGGSDTFASATGKGTLTVSGGTLNISGMLKLWNNATASYSGGSMGLGGLDVTGGLFKIVAGKSRVLRTASISTSSGGKVDLNDNSIIVDYPDGGPSPESSIAAQIQSGYAGGAWNGPGIDSSVAAGDSSKRIGYADNALLGQSSFSGEPVDPSSILIKLTWGGDANLDGAVNIADLEAVALHYDQSGDWLQGDFNYDGVVNLDDLKILASNWNAVDPLAAEETSLGLPVIVPEPSVGAFAMIAFCTGLSRRRSRRH